MTLTDADFTPEEVSEAALYGLVTLEWLTTTSVGMSEALSALLSLRGGRARSLPLTTPRGVQRLWVRVRADRGARCEAIFEFRSSESP